MPTPVSFLSNNVGSTPVAVTTAANTHAIIGVNFSNKLPTTIQCYLTVSRGGANTYLIDGIQLTANNTGSFLGGDSKHFIMANDVLYVSTNSVNGADVIISAVMDAK